MKLPVALAINSPAPSKISATQKHSVRVRRSTRPTALISPLVLPMKWVAMSMVTIEQPGICARIAPAMAASSTLISTPPWKLPM
ncbi:hypothetical protein D3C81_2004940 [compost metagenome]